MLQPCKGKAFLPMLYWDWHGHTDNPMSVRDVYNSAVKPLTVADRLRLATMILNEIPPQALADYQDAWTDEDLRDFSASALNNAPSSKGDEDAEAR